MNLFQHTLELIAQAKSRGVSVEEMANAAGVSTRWWYQLMSGAMRDPSVHKVQRLHDWLEETLARPMRVEQEQQEQTETA